MVTLFYRKFVYFIRRSVCPLSNPDVPMVVHKSSREDILPLLEPAFFASNHAGQKSGMANLIKKFEETRYLFLLYTQFVAQIMFYKNCMKNSTSWQFFAFLYSLYLLQISFFHIQFFKGRNIRRFFYLPLCKPQLQ